MGIALSGDMEEIVGSGDGSKLRNSRKNEKRKVNRDYNGGLERYLEKERSVHDTEEKVLGGTPERRT